MSLSIVSDVRERPFVSRPKPTARKKASAWSILPCLSYKSADRSNSVNRQTLARRSGRAPIALAVFALLGLTREACAASFEFNDSGWEGSSELLRLARSRLGTDRVCLVAALDYASLRPADGLLILHPTVSLASDALDEFMLSGGRVAVLDDFGSSGSFLERFGIRRTNPPLRPRETLRGNPNLAWAVPIHNSGDGQGESVHSMVVGLSRLLTNHPTTFTNPGLTPVLEIRAADGTAYPLAISGVIKQRGRLFVMGDPSAVINLMLRYPENRLYAERLIEYLVMDDTWGVRGGKLYLVANGFSQLNTRADVLAPQFLVSRLRDGGRALLQMRVSEFTAWILGLIVALAIGREAWQRLGKRADVYRPRFAMPVPLVSQPGEAGRAAVLAAPSTPRGLILLELMSGVTAHLAARLDINENAGMLRVFDAALERQLLNQTQRKELQMLVALVNRVQTALTRGGQARVRQKELSRAHRLMLDITQSIEHRQRK